MYLNNCLNVLRLGSVDTRTPPSCSRNVNKENSSKSFTGSKKIQRRSSFTPVSFTLPKTHRNCPHTRLAATASAPSDDVQSAVETVEKAGKILDEILKEVKDTMFVESAAADIVGGEMDVSQEQAMHNAVKSRIQELDAGFLAALAAYQRAAEAKGDQGAAELLSQVRSEVLFAVSKRLPAPMQVVDMAVREADQQERRALLMRSVSQEEEEEKAEEEGDAVKQTQGRDLPPRCTPDQLALAAGQLIDDMERMDEIPDWQLLFRLCAVREMVREMGLDDVRSARQTVPPSQAMSAESYLVNQLATLPDRMKRKAYLKATFAQSQTQDRRDAQDRRERTTGRERSPQSENESGVVGIRPGRFMDSLLGLLLEMESETGWNAGAPRHMVKNMKDLFKDSVEVLEELS